MFDVIMNGQKVRVYTAGDIKKYMSVVNDPRYDLDDFFLCVWKSLSGGEKSSYELMAGGEIISDGLFVRKSMTRSELYDLMGYQTLDFAWPEPWSDSPEGVIAMKRHGWKGPGTSYPSLVWVYKGPGEERSSIFGRPVFDSDVIKDMGRQILDMLHNGPIEPVKWPYVKESEDSENVGLTSETVDPDFDPDLDAMETDRGRS